MRLHLNFVACLLFVIRKYVDQSELLTRFRTDFTLSVWNFCLSSYRAFSLRGQHLRKYIGTKGCVCIRKEFNSHRTGLGHQHGRRFIVLEHLHGCENDPKINTISAREIIQLFVKWLLEALFSVGNKVILTVVLQQNQIYDPIISWQG